MRTNAFLILTLLLQQSARTQNLPQPTECIPQDAVIVLEIPQPKALLDPLLSPDMAKAAAALSANRGGNPKLEQLQAVVAYLEQQVGTDWRTGLRQLVGRGLVFAVQPTGGTFLAVDAQDEKLLKQLEEIIRQFATNEAANKNQPERVASSDYKGVTTWKLGPNEVHAILGNRLMLANRPEALERALDLRGDAKGKNIASSALFQAARQAVGKDAVVTAFLNLQALQQVPDFKKALADDYNPLAMLLLGDTKEALRNASWLALGVYVREGKLTLKTFTDGKTAESAKSASFSQLHAPDSGVLPSLSAPGNIASLSLCRDLRAFYTAKDDLFPERTSGLVFFENMMGIFFSGIDLTEGVLAQLKPDIRLIVATQQYDPAIGTPSVQMPAFAAVLRLRNPQTFGDTVEEAWQKALGLVNFTRGQKALPGLVIDRASYADVKYTVSYYRPPSEKEKGSIEARYNYRPSLARPGDYVIISSTDGLAKNLIDALKNEAASSVKPSQAAHSLADIDGRQLRAILAANREHLVQKNMIEKGNSREQAETDIGGFLTVLDCLDHATFTLRRDKGHPNATLELKLKLPSTKSDKGTAMNDATDSEIQNLKPAVNSKEIPSS